MRIYYRIEHRVGLPGDSETLRSQKTLLMLLMIAGGFLTFVNAAYYLSIGMTTASLISMSLAIFVLLCTLIFLAVPPLWRPLGYMVIFAIFAANMAVHIVVGGFQSGLEAAIWIMLGPIAAALLFGPRFTVISLIVYILCILIAAFLEPFAQSIAPEIMLAVRMRIAATNMILIGIFITASSLYLLRQVDYYRRRADELLHNMLPGPIAARLKISQDTIADAYEEVTVLFADMVGSTPLFSDLEPSAAVDWLNEVFTMFDQLVQKYGLEKIRTIGDNYMVAAGVPVPREDHAQAMAHFALDMQSGLEDIPARGGKKMAFRVGINSGPLVAGVIGQAKYQYDLWGDTVNLASRMESHGEAGKVHVSPSTYDLIKENFDCTSRGNIPIKGKGEMETWYVVDRMSEKKMDD